VTGGAGERPELTEVNARKPGTRGHQWGLPPSLGR
jgi:hypothetical protein